MVWDVSSIVSGERGFALGLSKLEGDSTQMRTRSPSSWKGARHTGGRGEREQVTLGEGTMLFRGEEEMTKWEEKRPECDRRL